MKKMIASLLLLHALGQAGAQVDAHFSQYYAHPLWLNPALTGAFDGTVRVTGIYRSQWSGITNPYSTAGLSADIVTGKNLNLGVNLLNQTAGDAGYRFMNGSFTIAYSGVRFGVDATQQLVVGLQFGFLNRRFDPSRFQFGSQWNAATGFDPTTPSGDLVAKTGATALDAGAGIAWLDATPDKNINPFAGFSITHLTKPADPFLAGSKSYLPYRYAFHGGLRVHLSETATLTPNFLYMRQGDADEKMIGAGADVTVNETTNLLFGVNYRVQDAVAPFAGVRFNNFTLGLSYDNNISNLGKMAGKANAFEISLGFITRSGYKGIPCPKF